MTEPLLSVEDLYIRFKTYAGTVHAVNGMSFHIHPGEIFGLVGESGCGKSVTGLAVLGMVPYPGEVIAGRILFHGENLLQKNRREMEQIRGGRIAMIFQDPSASLNPVFTVGSQISRIIRHHRRVDRHEARALALAGFEAVGLPDPARIFRAYPHELSGGMQQRVMIAMALASGAELLIADEPTTALDVTIQAQILALLNDLRAAQGVSILLITHDLGVVAETCDRVGVAYAGSIVETGPTAQVLYQMKHPYTRGLLEALPRPSHRGKALQSIPGSVPSGLDLPSGCPFWPRCPEVMDICREQKPLPTRLDEVGHRVACHLYSREGQR
ncbi:MAG: ABC transporter ATP-binding protein [Chloroflexi bacterium]|nr:MAG: ABC transporter ATP-binding protein [Chloroflexota bacterium]